MPTQCPSDSSHPLAIREPVEHIHASDLTSKEFQKRYLRPGQPVVVHGLLDLEREWDLDYLYEYLKDQIFPIRHYGRERYQQDKRQWSSSGSGVEARCMRFGDYANLIKTGEAYERDLYLARCSLKQTPLAEQPTLTYAETWLGLKAPATYLNLWLGPGGHTSSLHYDPMDGVLMQLHGLKKVILFPPSQTYNLYPIPVYKQLFHGLTLRSVYSQVYPENPDLDAFPKFRQAIPQAQECILKPGDVLFLPAGWWHEVTSLGDGISSSVNRFWHVFPLSRALLSWNKWRAHLGSVFAIPQTLWQFPAALSKGNVQQELKKLVQRL